MYQDQMVGFVEIFDCKLDCVCDLVSHLLHLDVLRLLEYSFGQHFDFNFNNFNNT